MIRTYHKRIVTLLLVVIMMMTMLLTGCQEPEKELTPPNDVTMPTESITISADVTDASEPDATEAIVNTTESTDAEVETTEPVIDAENTEAIDDITEPAVETGLSEDPFSYQISIDGTVIQLPCNVSEFTALGWVMDDTKADNTLDENYTTGVNVYNGDQFITLSIYNDGDAAVKFTDAMVDDVAIHDVSVEGHEIFICGGLTIGSTKDEVKAIYGNEPTRETTNGSNSSFTYQGESYRYRIVFSFRDDVVSGIDICAG